MDCSHMFDLARSVMDCSHMFDLARRVMDCSHRFDNCLTLSLQEVPWIAHTCLTLLESHGLLTHV